MRTPRLELLHVLPLRCCVDKSPDGFYTLCYGLQRIAFSGALSIKLCAALFITGP